MRIILYPIGGLANRMRAIDSAVNLCRANDKLTVWWVKDGGLNCDFGKIFKQVSFIQDKEVSKTFRWILKRYEKNNNILRILIFMLEKLHILILYDDIQGVKNSNCVKNDGRYLICFIRSWEAFFPLQTFHNELFVHQDFDKLKEEEAKINKETVGIHIRRTDNIWSVENSPLEVFETAMKKELEKNPNTDFYLCSDDDKTKAYFQSGDWKGKVKMPSGVLSRRTEEGIIQAACEMYTLSETRKILGSYWSSFGEVAARLGNIEIEICTTSQS